MAAPSTPSVVIDRNAAIPFASLSPDGGWLAYESSEFGPPEVYVESYPSPTEPSGGNRRQYSASCCSASACEAKRCTVTPGLECSVIDSSIPSRTRLSWEPATV
jgi:hypothetical protein